VSRGTSWRHTVSDNDVKSTRAYGPSDVCERGRRCNLSQRRETFRWSASDCETCGKSHILPTILHERLISSRKSSQNQVATRQTSSIDAFVCEFRRIASSDKSKICVHSKELVINAAATKKVKSCMTGTRSGSLGVTVVQQKAKAIFAQSDVHNDNVLATRCNGGHVDVTQRATVE
jgi:hypothetical protein